MIQLIGPGGAGKTTLGAALAQRIGFAFYDLDMEFMKKHGDISTFISEHGYQAYAYWNVECYQDLIERMSTKEIIALSSGFMTYPEDIHPLYVALSTQILKSRSTFLLLPSFDKESCINATVHRQLKRPFARSAKREEEVIRSRFSLYAELPVQKIETLHPVFAVVEDVLCLLDRI